jgi:hypothetical protein
MVLCRSNLDSITNIYKFSIPIILNFDMMAEQEQKQEQKQERELDKVERAEQAVKRMEESEKRLDEKIAKLQELEANRLLGSVAGGRPADIPPVDPAKKMADEIVKAFK